MLYENALRLVEEIPESAVVCDIGGGAQPFPRADHVIDALPYVERAALGELKLGVAPRYSEATWHQVDLCGRNKWPFEDDAFDFAVCSHVLEDVRDPIWICSEMCRISKKGYIETPSRTLEQSLGIEHPRYAGFYHHRWLISEEEDCLVFRFKPHVLHSCRNAIVANVGVWRELNPKYSTLAYYWTGSLEYKELMEFSEERMVAELCAYAEKARKLPDLIVRSERPFLDKAKRQLYFRRLARGRR